jgi:hypothetical protein
VPTNTATCDVNQIPTYFTNIGSYASWRGVPNVNNTAFQSIWIGRQYRYTNTTFTASATKPFGFEILRRNAWVDPVGACRETGANPSSRQQAEVSLWLYQEMTLGGDLQPYPNSVDFAEYDQGVTPGTGNTITNNTSKWVIYDGVQRAVDLTNGVGPKGEQVNLSANSLPGNTNLNWFYQDHLNGTNNTNALAFRITHDGNTIRFYINANPLDNPSCGFANQMVLVDSRTVAWNSNFSLMFGQGINRFDQEFAYAEYDYVLIRSVAAETFYQDVKRDSWAGLDRSLFHQITLEAKVETNDAGIGEILLAKSPTAGSWQMSTLEIFKNDLAVPIRLSSANPEPVAIAASVLPDGKLLLRLNKTSRQTNDIWRGKETFRIHVSHGTSILAAEGDLTLYVANEKYSDTAPSLAVVSTGLAYATTGIQKSTLQPTALQASPRLPRTADPENTAILVK